MNCRIVIVVLLLAISFIGCGKTTETDLDGTWVGESAGFSNKEGKKGRFRQTWTFKDGTISVESPRPPNDVRLLTYKVDVTKEPKQIDLMRRLPSGDEELEMGIYKIENDVLTIYHLVPKWVKGDATRPENFDTRQHDAILLTFQRKKDAPKKEEASIEGQ